VCRGSGGEVRLLDAGTVMFGFADNLKERKGSPDCHREGRSVFWGIQKTESAKQLSKKTFGEEEITAGKFEEQTQAEEGKMTSKKKQGETGFKKPCEKARHKGISNAHREKEREIIKRKLINVRK